MTSALIEQLHSRHGFALLDADNYEPFVLAAGDTVLFFTNDPAQFPESHDVAVILPELAKAFNGRLQAAVVARGIERDLQARFRFTGWPSLVFLRGGDYLGAITGIQDWRDYLRESARILAQAPSEPPPFDLDKVCRPAPV